jgi:hypothetical protein
MDGNVPNWTREHYGQTLYGNAFEANPQAQWAVVRGEISKYIAKAQSMYPNATNQQLSDAAIAGWFAGPGNISAPFRGNYGINDTYTSLGTYLSQSQYKYNQWYSGMQRLASARGYFSVY